MSKGPLIIIEVILAVVSLSLGIVEIVMGLPPLRVAPLFVCGASMVLMAAGNFLSY
jgi:hypothetical protein